jgi:hypothetical protein
MNIGDYVPIVYEKGVNETSLDISEGEVFWTIQLDKNSHMDCVKQVDAEILSRLVKIELLLRRKVRK